MDLNFDFTGVKCHIAIEKEVVDRIERLGRTAREVFGEFQTVFVAPTGWTERDLATLTKKLVDGEDLATIASSFGREEAKVRERLAELVESLMEDLPLKKVLDRFGGHPVVKAIVQEIMERV